MALLERLKYVQGYQAHTRPRKSKRTALTAVLVAQHVYHLDQCCAIESACLITLLLCYSAELAID